MNKKITLLLALLYACTAQAQLRAGADFGPAFTLKGKKNDTAFFGRNYFNTQLRLGFHKGRIGLVVTGGMINQNAGEAPAEERLNINTQGIPLKYTFSGGDVKNTFFTAGPEICFPFGKVRLTVHVAAGISIVSAEATSITREGAVVDTTYKSQMEKNNTGITKAGAGLNFYFNKRMAFTLNSEYVGYKLKYNNLDRRNSQGQQLKPVMERKSLLAVTGGITFKL